MGSRAGRIAAAAAVGLALLGGCSDTDPTPVVITTRPPDPASSTPSAAGPEIEASIELTVDDVVVEGDWLDHALCTTTADRLSFAAADDTSSVTGEILLDGGPTLRAVVYTRGVTTYTSDLLDPGTVSESASGYVITAEVATPGGDDRLGIALTVACAS